jgi:phosphate transport system substrate-binding protein
MSICIFTFSMNQLLIKKILIPVLIGTALVFHSCNNESNKETTVQNSHSSGSLKILSDETFRPIMGTSVETFEATYPEAKIQLEYKPQEESFTELLKGNVDVIIVGRTLRKDEEQLVRNKGLIPKINKIASDGILFIAGKKSSTERISEEKIAAILSGKEQGQFVCDKSNSGNLRYLNERFTLQNKISNIAAAGSDSAVIEYVIAHPESIGIIGMAFVSDLEDPKAKERLTKVNLLSIEYKDSLGKTIVGIPSLDELATEKYPFIRDIFIINLDGNMNLGTGFANFIVGEKGQRIILKAGILPSQLPAREILIVK